MELEMYVILLMFIIAGVGYIAAINARGVVRVALSYVLATLILVTSILTVFRYNNEKVMKELAKKESLLAERARQDEVVRQQKAEEDAKAAAALAAQANAGTVQGTLQGTLQTDLAKISNDGAEIARGILAMNVDDESADYDAMVQKAGTLKGRAIDLKKQLETALNNAPATPEVSAVKELITKAVRELNVGANYFTLYFKAEDENQENERYDTYQQNTKAAKADFSRTLEKLSGK